MIERLLRQLSAVNWDFPGLNPDVTSAIHWYPGTFPAQMPAALVEALSGKGDMVFDPYGGIGTTAVEAVRLGRKAWTVDINPVACLSAYVLGGLLLLKTGRQVDISGLFAVIQDAVLHRNGQDKWLGLAGLEAAQKSSNLLDQTIRPRPQAMLNIMITHMPAQWSLLQKWFEPATLSQVKRLLTRIVETEMPPFSSLIALTMLSAVLRASCSQTRSYGHVADNCFPKVFTYKELGSLCRHWLGRTASVVARVRTDTLDSTQYRGVRFWVTMHDWAVAISSLTPRPGNKSKLLVTSPPYANAIDYTRGQRLSLYLLGYDDDAIATLGSHEIGARRKRFHADSEKRWAQDLSQAMVAQLNLVDDEGIIALVLPHKDHGREAGSAGLKSILIEYGWKCIFTTPRSIRQFRTRHSWTSIKRETIEIYQKNG
ncbi:MAG: DNA methyltransferase [bacterium]